MRERHSAILKRLVKATPTSMGDHFVEQNIPDSPSDHRPGLVTINSTTGEAVIAQCIYFLLYHVINNYCILHLTIISCH